MRSFRLGLVLTAGVCLLGTPGSARAQQAPSADSNATDVAAARELGTEGVRLAQEGKCTEAIDYLTRASRLLSAPSIVVPLGECQVSLGRLVEGTESLQRALREPLPSNAPRAFLDAQQRARALLSTTMPRIARLRIVVEPEGVSPKVTVDQQPVSDALLGSFRPTDPGTRVVEAVARGYRKTSMTIKLAEGQQETMKVKLEFDPTAPPIPADPINQAGTNPSKEVVVPPPDDASDGSKGYDSMRTSAFFALGAGVIGIGVGVGFGIAATSNKSQLDGECADKHCPTSAKDDLDGLNRNATVSTVGLIAGGVLAATGVVLLIASGSKKKSATSGFQTTTARYGLNAKGFVGSF